MVKIPCLNDTFSEIFKLEASAVDASSLVQKDKKRIKRKGEKENRIKGLKTRVTFSKF